MTHTNDRGLPITRDEALSHLPHRTRTAPATAPSRIEAIARSKIVDRLVWAVPVAAGAVWVGMFIWAAL
jgi:hypothetical protein